MMPCVELRGKPWWRWVITLCAFSQIFLIVGFLYTFTILFVSLQSEFNSSSTATGWVGSLSLALLCFITPLATFLEQKFHKRTIIIAGDFIFCVGVLTTSFVSTLSYTYLTFSVLTGLGSSFVFNTSMSLVLDWFLVDFSRASAIVLLGTAFGTLVYSPAMTVGIRHFGWRNTLRIMSGAILFLGVICSLFMIDPPATAKPESPKESQNKETSTSDRCVEIKDSCSQDMDNQDAKLTVEDGVNDAQGSGSLSHSQVDDSRYCRRMMRFVKDPQLWLWSVGNIFSFLGWTFFSINFASFMVERDFSSNEITIALVNYSLGEIGGKILLAFIGDRLPFMHMYYMLGSCLFGTVILGLLTAAETYTSVICLALASGFLRSGVYGTSFAAAEQLFHEVYGQESVVILSLFPVGFGVLLSAPLSGVLYDATGDYVLSLLVIAVLFICASVAFLMIGIHRKFQGRYPCCTTQMPAPLHYFLMGQVIARDTQT